MFELWKTNIFPSIFPFLVISSILIDIGFVDIITKLFKPIMKIFKINNNTSFILVMSMLSGFPSASKYTKDLLDKKIIDTKSANKILMFTHFSNPLFILGTIKLYLGKYAYIVLIAHYISNFIVGILIRNYNKTTNTSNYKTNKNINIFNSLITSLSKALEITFLILGTVCFYAVIITIINHNIDNQFIKAIISGLVEVTQGIKYISLLNISIKLKTILTTSLLSFGGLAIHTQIYSVIQNTDIKYKPFLIGRILHSIISIIIVCILI